jgi:hypothetical protein
LLLNCSRQAGKTSVVAAAALDEALFNPPALVLLLSPSQRQSQELFRQVMQLHGRLGIAIEPEAESTLRIELPSGSRIIALPGKEQTVRGFSSVGLLVIDEAARVADDMPLIPSEESKCATALAKLQAARAKLEAEAITDQGRLEGLRAQQGDAELSALLEGADVTPIRREISDMQIKTAGRAAALPVLLEKIRSAMKDLARAKAAAIRAKAAKLQAKLDAHLAERGKLLEALQEFSGCRWHIDMRPIMAPGTAFAPGDPLKYPPMPRALAMETEIKQRLAEAQRIEDQAADASKGGRISGANLAELLAVCDNVELLAPTRASIEAWYTEATRRADVSWRATLLDYPGQVKPGREVLYNLAWDADGNIDPRESRAVNREVTFQGGQAA